MRASEWQYLCAVHDPPKLCCAIDYCCHTLDWAANILTSQKHFPSRLTLGGDAPGGSQASVRQLTNIFRRVYRMFAHAWFQHKDVFWSLENQEGIYVFYKTVCDIYQLIPEENYTIPPEAEGLALEEEEQPLRREQDLPDYPNHQRRSGVPEKTSTSNQADNSSTQKTTTTTTTISTGATTRRHKHTPSTGSFVTTIQEGDEEGEDPREAADPPLDTASTISIVEPAQQRSDGDPGSPVDATKESNVEPQQASAANEIENASAHESPAAVGRTNSPKKESGQREETPASEPSPLPAETKSQSAEAESSG